MRCDETNRESIVLLIHGELDGEQRFRLERHLQECRACAAAAAEETALKDLVTAAAAGDAPSADLLRRCRDDLGRALAKEAPAAPDQAPAGTRAPGWAGWRIRFNPAWALLLVAAGFLGGRALPPRAAPSGGGDEVPAEGASTIANVEFHDSDPASDRVSLTYDTLSRTSLTGSASDPRIRRVLVETARDSRNAGLRLMALDVLRRHLDDRDVRQAMVHAVREDDNAGARLLALEALRGRAGDDPEVRGAIVEALTRDTNPGVRVRAVDALEGAHGPETLAVLRRLADRDPNEYVRLRSAALVSAMVPAAQETVR